MADAGLKAQVPPTRQTGPESATGAAIADAEGTRDDIPQGEDAGSKVPIAGDIRPDSEGPQEPQEGQAQPAQFTSNGQLPHRHVPTPSGAVPVGAVATSVEDADKRVDDVTKKHEERLARLNAPARTALTDEQIAKTPSAELRAIGEARGYEISPDHGPRATRTAFAKAQSEDEDAEEPEDQAEKPIRRSPAAKKSAAAKKRGR